MKKSKSILLGTLGVIGGLGLSFMVIAGFIGMKARNGDTVLKKEFEAYYPEDEFSNVQSMMKTKEPVLEMDSARFPGKKIRVTRRDGEIVSNYPAYIHGDAISDYYVDIADDYIDCDNMRANWCGSERGFVSYFPLEDISDEEFIDRYVDNYEFHLSLYYDEFPSREEIQADLTELAGSLDSPCYIGVFLYHTGDTDEDNCECSYFCTVDENNNCTITVNEHHVTLEDQDI